MKKVLILGALAGQVDAIDALHARGVEVHAAGHVASGPGVDAADVFHEVDITDVDAVTALASAQGHDVVYSVGSDIAMPTVTAVSEALGLPYFHGSALTTVLRQKELMREKLSTLPSGSVAYTALAPDAEVAGWSTFPAIVKPDDSQGQRGITVVNASDGLDAAVAVAREHSRSGVVLIEELLEGPEVSVHVVVVDGQVRFFMPTTRFVWEGPLVGIPRAHGIPFDNAQAHDQLRTLVEESVAALGVTDGPLYFQTFVTPRGPRVVEIASRLDGCHLWRMIREATGFDLLDAVLGRLLGEPWPDFTVIPAPEPMVLEFFLDAPETVATSEYQRGVEHQHARHIEWHLEDGDTPRRTNDVVARLGYQIYPGVAS